MQTPAECRLRLRNALFNDDGKDKDCVKDFAPFMTYAKDGLELNFKFYTGKQLHKKQAQLLVSKRDSCLGCQCAPQRCHLS